MPTELRQLITELLSMYRKQCPCESMSLDNPNVVKLGIKFIELGNKIIHPPIPIYNKATVLHYLAESWHTNCFGHYHHLQPHHIQMIIEALTRLSIVLQVVYGFLHELNNDPPLSLVRTEMTANNIKRFHPMPSAHCDPRRIKILLNREANITTYDTFYRHCLNNNLCQMIKWHLEALSSLAKTSQPTNHLSLEYSTLDQFLSFLQKPLSVRIQSAVFNQSPLKPKQLKYHLTEASKAQQTSEISPKTPKPDLIELSVLNYQGKIPRNGNMFNDYILMLQQIIAFAHQPNCLDAAIYQLNNNPYYSELKELICDELCLEGQLTKADLYNFTL